jgi:hypothetical protein
VLPVVMLLTGCSQFALSGLALSADRSISITSPSDRGRVTKPLGVSWTDRAPRPGGSYVVLIDRTPMPPGETVRWFARGDADCATTPTCPNALYLARRGITVTTATSATIAIVPALGRAQARGYHELTVIRLDPDGRRDGETAATVQFKVAGR